MIIKTYLIIHPPAKFMKSYFCLIIIPYSCSVPRRLSRKRSSKREGKTRKEGKGRKRQTKEDR